MIPLSKLSKLPRSQKLRKAAKVIGEAELRLLVSGNFPDDEAKYLGGLMELLNGDFSLFPKDTTGNEEFINGTLINDALLKARTCFINPGANINEIRRSLNSVYHLLLAETGRYPSDWDFIEPSGALDGSKRRAFQGMQVYLEDIRSPFNVGAMFRAAESFGAEKLWLSPLCADPRHKRASRTAMGCVDILPWERLPVDPFTEQLPGQKISPFSGCPVFALETGGRPLAEFPFPVRGILIAGSEELGVSPGALSAADSSLGRVTIPVYGAKGSLNVSVAFGIVMQAWAVKREKIKGKKEK